MSVCMSLHYWFQVSNSHRHIWSNLSTSPQRVKDHVPSHRYRYNGVTTLPLRILRELSTVYTDHEIFFKTHNCSISVESPPYIEAFLEPGPFRRRRLPRRRSQAQTDGHTIRDRREKLYTVAVHRFLLSSMIWTSNSGFSDFGCLELECKCDLFTHPWS